MRDQYTFDAAPYVLGGLSPDERREFEEHLRDCPSCTVEVRELSELRPLLAQLPADDPALTLPDEDLEPPATLLPALLGNVRRERHQRRWRVTWAAGLAAACLAALGAVVAVQTGGTPSRPSAAPTTAPTVAPTTASTTPPTATPTTAPALAFRPVGGVSVRATATLIPKGWGTEIRLWCKYIGGPWGHEPLVYALVGYDRAGVRYPMGSWSVLPNRDENLTASTALTRDQLSRLQVVEPTSNAAVLDLRLSAS